MVWLIIPIGLAIVVAIALFAVGRVSAELESTVTPALLQVDDAVEAVSEALPFEVSAAISFEDVDQIIRWVLDWFDQIGLGSDYGEELGGDWVIDDPAFADGVGAVADEVGAAEYAVSRGVDERPDIDPVHTTVVVDEFMRYLADIDAVGSEVDEHD